MPIISKMNIDDSIFEYALTHDFSKAVKRYIATHAKQKDVYSGDVWRTKTQVTYETFDTYTDVARQIDKLIETLEQKKLELLAKGKQVCEGDTDVVLYPQTNDKVVMNKKGSYKIESLQSDDIDTIMKS